MKGSNEAPRFRIIVVQSKSYGRTLVERTVPNSATRRVFSVVVITMLVWLLHCSQNVPQEDMANGIRENVCTKFCLLLL